MERTILQYQKAYNSIIEKLRRQKQVVGIMVFGSMVSGDLWEESDIDLFVIVAQGPNYIKNIYLDEKGVPVHIKLMSREKFLNLHKRDLKGGFIHRIFSSSKLVYAKDKEITERYDQGRYYPDMDRERWNISYLGKVIKSIGISKKYLYNNSIYTAYGAMISCFEDFAKLYVNFSGYMISKDALSMAMNLDDGFKHQVDDLIYCKENLEECIENNVQYIQRYLDNNLKSVCNLLLEYMKQEDKLLSATEIKESDLFIDFNIPMEDILARLWERNIIKRDFRDYKNAEEVLVKENVYYL